MNPDNSWIGELEWKNGVPKDDKIELDFLDRRSDTDETECYWMITDTWDYGIRTYTSIELKEVLGNRSKHRLTSTPLTGRWTKSPFWKNSETTTI